NIFNQTLSGDNNPASGFNPLTYQLPNFDTSVDRSNPVFAAQGDLLNRQTQMGLADLRTRFGAAGGAPRGSNAAFAEGNFLAQANPSNMLAMQQLADAMQANKRADVGMQAQDTLARMGLGMQNQQMGQQYDLARAGMLM